MAKTKKIVEDPEADGSAERCRRSLAFFLRQGWHVLEPTTKLAWNWHLDAIADHVQAVLLDWQARQADPHAVQRIQNLLVNVPPGTLKSRVLVYAVPWLWLRCPSFRAICLSANPRVALRDSMFAREVITSPWYQETFRPTWQLREDANAKSFFANTAAGSRSAMGMTSTITGERADAIIVDDPHDADAVHSDAERTAVLERWDAAIGNRVNDLRTSVRIGIMQRVHEEDWSAHVLGQGGWEHLMIPMEYEPERARTTAIGWTDPRKEPGECLHPERFTPEVLASERRRLGAYGYAGQMQQRPAPLDGGLFPPKAWAWWRPDGVAPTGTDGVLWRRPRGCSEALALTLPPKFDQVVVSVDCAFKDTGDYVAIVVVGAKGAHRFVLEVVRQRMDFTRTCAALKAVAARYPRAKVLVEAAANGHAVVNALQAVVSGIVPVPALGSKEARAQACSPQVEAHQVFLAEGAAWVGEFVDELAVFPRGKHDDQVDGLSMALNHMTTVSPADFARRLNTL